MVHRIFYPHTLRNEIISQKGLAIAGTGLLSSGSGCRTRSFNIGKALHCNFYHWVIASYVVLRITTDYLVLRPQHKKQ